MKATREKEMKVQAILRMPTETYEAIRGAARRAKVSFNAYAVAALGRAAASPAKRMHRSELALDPILEALMVESFSLTPEDVAENPRIAKLLSE